VTYPLADITSQWFADNYSSTAFAAVEKVVWHTTESTLWPGYDGGAKAPHYTAYPDYSARKMRWRAHFPDRVNSRAMRNEPGGVQTNLDGALQVEIVGTCDPSRMRVWRGMFLRSWDLEDWQVSGLADFAAWVHDEHGVPLTAVPKWLAYPGSYGATSARMTGKSWDAFRGHCGHMHVPENAHGDPGAFQISRVLSAAERLTIPTPAKKAADMELSDTVTLTDSDREMLGLQPGQNASVALLLRRAARSEGKIDALSEQVDALIKRLDAAAG
jgi:hypothetical protein